MRRRRVCKSLMNLLALLEPSDYAGKKQSLKLTQRDSVIVRVGLRGKTINTQMEFEVRSVHAHVCLCVRVFVCPSSPIMASIQW